ncbi:heterokaryon incompatibility protein-domain-containing protein [Cercophora newfieldiana]|uniref:Heterokaryon incompatibility protein-domain-containing protein n=1 Tax=Cercophora newfieldiana TaxID=92897 RepID=A0AA39Y4X2_9PEZI|nr:heterokaryon incompatibility protein-domain-containing protein [Cercophora newfieldiana]
MRLIEVNTLELHEFMGSQLQDVDYAILSHTWGEEEVTFQEMQNLNRAVRKKKGFSKIFQAAQQAKDDGLNWVWVDTCCIDKTSSAELSEAINSMYMWYQRSRICYAYLADVSSHPPVEVDDTKFRRSRWFTRGWTLQELVAPRQLTFYSKDWTRIGEKLLDLPPASVVPDLVWGTKGRQTLCEASGIPYAVLFDGRPREQYSVAQRMSWASQRVCTRIEDTAYCMLGLFDVNMPLLYGEETKAFTRLQEEIIKANDDHSIYAWTVPQPVLNNNRGKWPGKNTDWTPHPVLAPSPLYFADCEDVHATGREFGEPSSLTKHGLRIELCLKRYNALPQAVHSFYDNTEVLFATLNCCLQKSGVLVPLCLPLVRVIRGVAQTHCYRIGTGQHTTPPSPDGAVENTEATTVYVRQKVPLSERLASEARLVLRFSNAQFYFPSLAPDVTTNTKCSTGFSIEVAGAGTEHPGSAIFNCLPLSVSSTDGTALGTAGAQYFALRWKDQSAVLLLGMKVYYYSSRHILHLLTRVFNPQSLAGNGWEGYAKDVDMSFEKFAQRYKSFPCSLPVMQLGEKSVQVKVKWSSTASDTPRVGRHVLAISFESVAA